MAHTYSGRLRRTGHIRKAAVATIAGFSLLLAACSTGADSSANGSSSETNAAAEQNTITVTDNHGDQTITTPIESVVATDNRSFEILNQWGIDLKAAPKGLVPFTVTDYKQDENILDMGSHREPNLEVVAAVDPQLIVNGQRFASQYDELKKLAPNAAIVEFDPREGEALDAELKRHAEGLGKIFNKEEEAQKLIEDFDKALERARAAYKPDMKVMALNSSGGNLGYIAPSVGRTFGPLFDLIEMTPALEVENSTDDHQGDEVSVETIADTNPDFIMVLDRDAGTSTRDTEEFRDAQSVLNSAEPLKNVKAVKEGNIYYAPEDTYTNESIITYTEILNGLADAFENA